MSFERAKRIICIEQLNLNHINDEKHLILSHSDVTDIQGAYFLSVIPLLCKFFIVYFIKHWSIIFFKRSFFPNLSKTVKTFLNTICTPSVGIEKKTNISCIVVSFVVTIYYNNAQNISEMCTF